MESWERKGNRRNLREAYFPILWIAPTFHVPGPRFPLTVALSPFSVSVSNNQMKRIMERGGGGVACDNKN